MNAESVLKNTESTGISYVDSVSGNSGVQADNQPALLRNWTANVHNRRSEPDREFYSAAWFCNLSFHAFPEVRPLLIYPAIDIRDGKCVRLIKGDYARETIYGDSPADMAEQWQQQGAQIIHVVDLDAAKDGTPKNYDAIEAIVRRVSVPVQLGGGIRDQDIIQRYTDLGVSRLVVGTKAVKDPQWFAEMAQAYPDRLVAGIDANGDDVATDGWIKSSGVSPITIAKQLESLPIAGIVYTDIAKDGMLQGPNLEAMTRMAQEVSASVIASGGVSNRDDIVALKTTGVSGCIVGRALYENRLTLPEALEAAK